METLQAYPYCINCKHSSPHSAAPDKPEHLCCKLEVRDSYRSLCAVLGPEEATKREEKYMHCTVCRMPAGECGPEGNLFEAKDQP